MTIVLEPKKVTIFLAGVMICLIAANVAGIISKYYLGLSRLNILNLDYEGNIPTFFSATILLLCSLILAIIAVAERRTQKNRYRYWAGLTGIFIFLSVDEAAALHERLINPLRIALNTSGIFYYAWVIPYGVLLCFIAIVYIRFLVSLPRRIRFLIVLAGAIYVTGVIGGELLGGYWTDVYGEENVAYALITMGEEVLEMVGVLAFIYGLLYYIKTQLPDLTICFGASHNV